MKKCAKLVISKNMVPGYGTKEL